MGFISIYITYPDKETAKSITDRLLDERLIACANIYPVDSSYHWKGKIEKEQEWVSLVKSKNSLFHEISALINDLHPYEVPCIMKTEVSANPEYESWVHEQLK